MVASFDTKLGLDPLLLRSEPASGLRCSVGSSDLRPGRRVSSNIELVRPLASGGMGQVWLAHHRALDIQVAVKFMKRDVADDPVSLVRFEQEAKLAARIKSPHVVEVLDYDVTVTGVPFIVMESLSGRELETALQNGRTLGISDTARVLVHVCKALSKAHAAGIIHRDIKAENVFVCEDEGAPLIKVLDFGVAKETATPASISLSGTTVGTPGYMSPEQLFHPKEIDLRTDLWATAVLVYRCLTGSFPFEGESFASVCVSVSKGKFATPSARNSVLPAGLDAWFKKAFHRNLNARFSSAIEMSEAFLNELRKADLLPSWAEASEASSSLATPFSRLAPRSRRRHRSLRKSPVAQAGIALATVLLFQVAPTPTRAMFGDFAGQATPMGRAWAVAEGIFSPRLAIDGEAWSPGPEVSPTPETAWAPSPATTALAERDVRRFAEVAHGPAPRYREIAPELVRPDFAATIDSETEVPSASKAAPETPPTDLATIRFGL